MIGERAAVCANAIPVYTTRSNKLESLRASKCRKYEDPPSKKESTTHFIFPCVNAFDDPNQQRSLFSLGMCGDARTLLLDCETESGGALGLVEDGVDVSEEDVAEDGETDTAVGLDAAEACRAAGGDGSVVDVAAGDGELCSANGDLEVGSVGGAWEGVATLRRVVAGT